MRGRARGPSAFQLLLLLGAILLVVFSCAAVQTRERIAEEKVLVRVAGPCPFTIVDDGRVVDVDWEYPITPRVWYPGDDFAQSHPYNYYAVRCWPGCHDPNSAPRPQHY